MLNRTLSFQTLVSILLLAVPAAADPPSALAGRVQHFRDWRLDCRADPCAALTSVRGADGSEVLRVSLAPGEVPVLALATPLPLFLPDGLALAVGDAAPVPVPWRTCTATGCEATLALDPALLAALRRAPGGSAAFTLVDGVTVRLPFSLRGFTAAEAAAADR